jgi:hypothetical protein
LKEPPGSPKIIVPLSAPAIIVLLKMVTVLISVSVPLSTLLNVFPSKEILITPFSPATITFLLSDIIPLKFSPGKDSLVILPESEIRSIRPSEPAAKKYYYTPLQNYNHPVLQKQRNQLKQRQIPEY